MEKFIHVDRCDSTQDLVKEQLMGNTSDELTVSCEHQTLGRGRGSNSWQDSSGTLCFSMTVLPHEKATFTALEISTLIADFFKLKGQEIKLKWPNDLITFDEKKCGGILIQNFESRYIAGVGINLYRNENDFGGIYETSFEIEKKAWAKEMSDYIRSHRYHSTSELILKWNTYCFHMDREVKITEGEIETRGKFIGLGPYGEALISNAQGTHHLFNGSLRLV